LSRFIACLTLIVMTSFFSMMKYSENTYSFFSTSFLLKISQTIKLPLDSASRLLIPWYTFLSFEKQCRLSIHKIRSNFCVSSFLTYPRFSASPYRLINYLILVENVYPIKI
jgi:hypothetical protein